MKWKYWLLISLISFPILFSVPISAQREPDLDRLCTKFPHNSRCEDYIPPAVIDGQRTTEPRTGYPIVNRDELLYEKDLPWSEPVMLRDTNADLELAVLDEDYPDRARGDVKNLAIRGLLSNWYGSGVEIYSFNVQESCFYFVCDRQRSINPVSIVQISIGDEIFELPHQKADRPDYYLFSKFALTPEIISKLQTASASQTDVFIRFFSIHEGARITRKIGEQTVATWATIYSTIDEAASSEALVMPADTPPWLHIQDYPEALTPLITLSSDLPVVEGDNWAQEESGPWSRLVQVQDRFDGNYVAVLDRYWQNRFLGGAKAGFLTNWNRRFVEVYFYSTGDGGRSYGSYNVNHLILHLPDESLELTGVNNRFPIDAEIAEKLRDLPEENLKVSIPTGNAEEELEFMIGKGTIAAWQTLYQE